MKTLIITNEREQTNAIRNILRLRDAENSNHGYVLCSDYGVGLKLMQSGDYGRVWLYDYQESRYGNRWDSTLSADQKDKLCNLGWDHQRQGSLEAFNMMAADTKSPAQIMPDKNAKPILEELCKLAEEHFPESKVPKDGYYKALIGERYLHPLNANAHKLLREYIGNPGMIGIRGEKVIIALNELLESDHIPDDIIEQIKKAKMSADGFGSLCEEIQETINEAHQTSWLDFISREEVTYEGPDETEQLQRELETNASSGTNSPDKFTAFISGRKDANTFSSPRKIALGFPKSVGKHSGDEVLEAEPLSERPWHSGRSSKAR